METTCGLLIIIHVDISLPDVKSCDKSFWVKCNGPYQTVHKPIITSKKFRTLRENLSEELKHSLI